MEQSKKPNRSSGCPKCGGYVDHIAMACIMCGADFQPHPPQDPEEEGDDESEVKVVAPH